MAINIDHSGALAGRLAALGYRTGQAEYVDRRRREESEMQLNLARLAQGQQQLEQNRSLAMQRLAEDRRQHDLGMVSRFAGMQLGAALDQQRDDQLHANRLDLLRQQQADSMQRAATAHEQNLNERSYAAGLALTEQQQADFRSSLGVEGKRKFDMYARQRASVMSDVNFSPPQRQEVLSQLQQRFDSEPWENYRGRPGDPGTEFAQSGQRFRVLDTGDIINLGPAIGGAGEPATMPEWYAQNIHTLPTGQLAYPEWSGRDRTWRIRTLGESPKVSQLTPLDEVNLRKAESEVERNRAAIGDMRVKQFTDLMSKRIKTLEGGDRPQFTAEEAWAIVDRGMGGAAPPQQPAEALQKTQPQGPAPGPANVPRTSQDFELAVANADRWSRQQIVEYAPRVVSRYIAIKEAAGGDPTKLDPGTRAEAERLLRIIKQYNLFGFGQ